MMSVLRNRKYLPYLTLGFLFLATTAYVLTVLPGRSAPPAPAPSPSAMPHADGLSDSFQGYAIKPVSLPEQRGQAIPVSFRIHGPDGAPLTAYQTAQDKQMHLYVVRDDVSGYQHLHPVLEGDLWKVAVDVPDGGSYRMYADFTPPGWPTGTPDAHPVILGLSFVIAGDTKLVPLPGPAATATAGPYTVERADGTANLIVGRSALLRFRVPGATLEPYLGTVAHMSAFETRTLGLIHLHPAANELTFHTQFPNRGEYRLFLEFKAGGQVHRADFTVFVT